jgi:chondroitin 4-sulfotransferase 11
MSSRLWNLARLLPEEQCLSVRHWLYKDAHAARRRQVRYVGQGDETITLTLRSFDAHRCIFVHIPKAAGISVATALFNTAGAGHHDVRYYREVFGADFWAYFKFTFVRNPFTRLVSAYEFLKRGGHPAWPEDAAFNKEVLSSYRDFGDFVLQWLPRQRRAVPRVRPPHFRPQVEYLMLSNRLALDFIGRYETLAGDFEVVRRRLHIDAELPHHNRTPVEDVSVASHYASDAVVRCVQDVYQADFELLGYPPQPPNSPTGS